MVEIWWNVVETPPEKKLIWKSHLIRWNIASSISIWTENFLKWKQKTLVEAKHCLTTIQPSFNNYSTIQQSFKSQSGQILEMAIELDFSLQLFHFSNKGNYFGQMSLQIFLSLAFIEQMQHFIFFLQ